MNARAARIVGGHLLFLFDFHLAVRRTGRILVHALIPWYVIKSYIMKLAG
jgi:hypothetical protein